MVMTIVVLVVVCCIIVNECGHSSCPINRARAIVVFLSREAGLKIPWAGFDYFKDTEELPQCYRRGDVIVIYGCTKAVCHVHVSSAS